jgi:hypothetical protein
VSPRYRPRSIVLAIAVFVVLCATPAADAKRERPEGKIRVVTITGQIPSDAPASVDPRCPRGLKAVGGGFRSFAIVVSGSGVPGGGPVVREVPVILESRRLHRSAWHISAQLVRNPVVASGPGTTTLYASVYCKAFPGKVSEVSAAGQVSASSATPSTATASCRRGRTAIAGGFSAAPAPGPAFVFPSIYESFRLGKRAWQSSAIPGNQPVVGVTSYVYCVKGGSAPVKRVGRRASGLTSSRECPKGLRAGAGGFQVAPTPGTVVITSEGPSLSERPGTASAGGKFWYIGVFSSGSDPGGRTVFVYCS